MFKLLRLAALALPLGGGLALAQGSGTNGSAGAPDNSVRATPDSSDTRTPTQKRAGSLDDNNSAAVPGDATKPNRLPETAPMNDRSGLPDATDCSSPTENKGKDKSSTLPKGDSSNQTPSDK